MSASLRFLVALLGLVVLVAAGFYFSHSSRPLAAQSSSDTASSDTARSKPSVKGLYVVAIEPEAGTVPQGDLHAWILTLKAADGTPVEGAGITVDGGMPAHAHGLPTSPAATAELGQGRYRIDGVRFNMGGLWQLRFSITAAAGADDAVFDIEV